MGGNKAPAPDIEIRYAASDQDVIDIHRFLCVVAGPTLPGPIDGPASATEVWRVTTAEAGIMAIRGDMLVGVIGVTKQGFWWNPKISFLANRFFFTLPGSGAARPLLKEATAIAVANEIELHIYDERKGRLKIFNRSRLRDRHPALANSPNSSRALAT